MISVVILTYNNEKTLEKVLQSTSKFDEVLIVDTGSTDKTLITAKKFQNTKIKECTFTQFGPLRNEAAKYAKNDWILALDSDEELSVSLQEEILNFSLDPQSIYSIPFLNFYNGKMIKSCGWYPESHPRLYHRNSTQFDEALIHEKLMQNGCKTVSLKNPIYHYSYHNIQDFLTKMQRYTSLFAKQYQHKKKSSTIKAISHASFAFFKSYFLKRGIFDGKEGLIISLYQANTALYKYLKLAEENQKPCS